MRNCLFAIFSLILFCACNSKQTPNDKSLVFTDKIELLERKVFDSGFRQFTNIEKTYSIGGEEYVGFIDKKTHKKLILHSLNSTKEYRVPLNEIVNRGENILSYDVLSLDTILIMSQGTNHLYLLNRDGEVQKSVNLNPIVNDHNGYNFICTGVNAPFMFNDSSLIMRIVAHRKDKEFIGYDDYYRPIYTDSVPFLLKVENIFSESLVAHFGLQGFNNNFLKEEHLHTLRSKLTFLNDQICVKSQYSDTLYVVDPISLTIKKRTRLKSDYIDQAIMSIPISLAEMDKGFDHNEHNNSFPYLSSKICYHSTKNQYLIGISNSKEPRIHSILVYDSSFIKQDELLLDSAIYATFYCLTTDDKLIIRDAKQHAKDEDFYEKNTFTLSSYK